MGPLARLKSTKDARMRERNKRLEKKWASQGEITTRNDLISRVRLSSELINDYMEKKGKYVRPIVLGLLLLFHLVSVLVIIFVL